MDEWIIPLYRIYSDDEDVNLITKIVRRGTSWSIGPEIKEFEDKLKEFSKEKQKENNGYPLDSKIKFSYRSGIDEYDKINSRFKCLYINLTQDPDDLLLPYYRIRFNAGKINNKETWRFAWDPNQKSNESIDLFIQIYEQSLKELIYSG